VDFLSVITLIVAGAVLMQTGELDWLRASSYRFFKGSCSVISCWWKVQHLLVQVDPS
jgi:hypothetical protein